MTKMTVKRCQMKSPGTSRKSPGNLQEISRKSLRYLCPQHPDKYFFILSRGSIIMSTKVKITLELDKQEPPCMRCNVQQECLKLQEAVACLGCLLSRQDCVFPEAW